VTAALDLFTRMPLGPTETWRIDLNDATEWLSQLSSESVDLVVTDPAYESLEKHRAKGTTTRLKVSDGSSNEWFPIFPNSRFPAFFAEVYRVLQPDSHFYMYCDQETAFIAKPLAEAAGFKFWKPLVWKKGKRIGMGYHYRAQYELILFFEKGKRRIADLSIADVIDVDPIRNGYPTEKPVSVSEVLIGQSTDRGQLVIDPFAGSASVGEAALKLGRRFAGCDVKESAVELGRSRLAAIGSAGESA
jgi:site-specific DNA-methyltransferase (adenine-specific)